MPASFLSIHTTDLSKVATKNEIRKGASTIFLNEVI